jgi:DEAD/DEAH box helicase domain-containing protein
MISFRYIPVTGETMTEPQTLDRLLKAWQRQPEIQDNVINWHIEPARPARWEEFPENFSSKLSHSLRSTGIKHLYSHQVEAYHLAEAGKHFVVTTGTASGKTLCYNLPVINQLIKNPDTRALYIFPTKALTQDQLNGINHLLNGLNPRPGAFVYDGDTPTSLRSRVRSTARLILTNPDMTHISILPHHTLWADFFRDLRFIIIDEIHIYRGVFGSHLSNLVRRIKRVAAFYGAHPQFFMTSATIGNPRQLAERLIEESVEVVDQDGSPHGARNIVLYNPPVVIPDLGIRRGAAAEATRLASDLLAYHVQTILYTRTRRGVEIMLRNMREQQPEFKADIHGYRSGYLASERRGIEQELRDGQAMAVIATNALELGINIGGLNAAILVGYPGTIAATRQQSGRAGRHSESALAVLVASASPLDQFLMKHPEYIFDQSPEQALIDPDNLLILLAHLRCAAFELPFQKGESFGHSPQALLEGLLDILTQSQVIHYANGKFFWSADQYPANHISLRTTSESPVLLQAEMENGRTVTVGEVDDASSRWMVHPHAIYIHLGREFEVTDLDLERHVALMKPVDVDYYTEAVQKITIEMITQLKQSSILGGTRNYGEILVTGQVVGYRRIRWGSMEILGDGSLDLPPTKLRTTAFWLALNDEIIETLRENGKWNNDPNMYGPNWNRQRNLARERDRYTCQACGMVEQGQAHHVHHKKPYRLFPGFIEANQLDNLVTLCPACHQRAEQEIRMRSGLAGLGYVVHHLAPLFLMCDIGDLGLNCDVKSPLTIDQPAVAIYDMVPGGIGLSERLYDIQDQLFAHAYSLVRDCACKDGCPSCIGPAGENGVGGKTECLALLRYLTGEAHG